MTSFEFNSAARLFKDTYWHTYARDSVHLTGEAQHAQDAWTAYVCQACGLPHVCSESLKIAYVGTFITCHTLEDVMYVRNKGRGVRSIFIRIIKRELYLVVELLLIVELCLTYIMFLICFNLDA